MVQTTSMLAAFVTPAILWGGTAVAAPILIHLFARRRFRRVRWAAIDFLLQAERVNRRRMRIEHLILRFNDGDALGVQDVHQLSVN